MSLRIRRGTDAQRATTPLDLGELVFTTDTKQLYVGNGIDAGGNPIIRLGTGLAWADTACTTIIATGAALQVSADTAPTLGGELVLGGYNITGTGNINITGTVTSTKLVAPIIDGAVDGVSITANGSTPLAVTGIGTLGATSGQVNFNIKVAKGTISAPLTTAAGDTLGGMIIQGYNGTDYKSASFMVASWEAGAVMTDAYPKSKLLFAIGGGGSVFRLATFDNQGIFSVPILKVGDVTGTLPSSPAAGMIVLDGTTFKGYNGSAWVNLN